MVITEKKIKFIGNIKIQKLSGAKSKKRRGKDTCTILKTKD